MEQILAWDPEVILTQEAGFAERVRQDPCGAASAPCAAAVCTARPCCRLAGWTARLA